MDYLEKIIADMECLSVEGIRSCFEHGIDPNTVFRGKPLIYELITEYGRGEKFSACVQEFIAFGLKFNDVVLLAVLSNNADQLKRELKINPKVINNKYSINCAFTPLYEVSLLHLCAEFNHVSCAEILLQHGVDVNEKAGVDVYGFGGQTPIFHTVNQHADAGKEMRNFLIAHGADLQETIKGFIWGKEYTWETLIPAVNPISYAMMGLLPQFHRSEQQIGDTVSDLLNAAFGINYTSQNIPNAYLKN